MLRGAAVHGEQPHGGAEPGVGRAGKGGGSLGPEPPGAAGGGAELPAWAAALATGYWVLLIPKAAMPVLAAVGFQLITSFYKNESQVRSEMVADDHVDALPLMYLDQLKWIPVLAFAVSTLQTVMQLLVTAAFCRLLPKVQPPFQRSLSIRTDRCAEDVHGAAGFGDVGRRLHRAVAHSDVRGILWARLRHGLAGDLAGDAGGGPRVLLRHGQYPHQCGRGPGSVQSALQDRHERPHLPGQSQPPAAGPSGGQLLRCRHLAAESAHRAQHELLRESRDEVPPPRQPIRRHPPGPRACELLVADVAPFQHQRHGRVPLSRRAGHGHGSGAAQQPPLLPGDHAVCS